MTDFVLSRRKAQAILKDFAFLPLRNTDIVDFVSALGINTEVRQLSSTAAMLTRRGEDAIISVDSNSQHHPGRFRFSVAHELGHFFLHSDQASAFSCTDDMFFEWYRGNQREPEANAFAAELLMPEDDFKLFIAGKNPSPEIIGDCVTFFGTSRTATCLRFVELAQQRMLLYVAVNGVITWYKASSSVPRSSILPLGARVSEFSCAGEFFLDGVEEETSANMASDVWINSVDEWQEEICETATYLRSRNTVVSLIWEP